MNEVTEVRCIVRNGGFLPATLRGFYRNGELEAWGGYEYDGDRFIPTSAFWGDKMRKRAESFLDRAQQGRFDNVVRPDNVNLFGYSSV